LRVILLVALKDSGDILDDWFKYINKLDPAPEQIIFCTNNSSDNTIEKLYSIDTDIKFRLIRFWTRSWKEVAKIDRYLTIAVARQFLLTKARYLDPDYAIFLDDDVFPKDKDMIKTLTTWGVDIVGGSYLRAFPFGIFIGSLWKDPTGRYKYTTYKKRHQPLDEPVATSAGCLCLSRKAIQDRRLNFYPRPKADASEDFGYCFKARELGYRIYLDGLVTLTHRLRKKDRAWMIQKDGKYIWEE